MSSQALIETIAICARCRSPLLRQGARCASCAASDAPDPASIGPFQVVHRLPAGAIGRAYLCHDPALGRRVVVKLFAGEREVGILADRYLRESRFAARVRHPNVASVYAIGRANGAPFVAMEHVEGTSVETLLARGGRLGEAEALAIARDAARGLQEAAAHKVLHRDLRPANLLVDAAGAVKVTDFGLAPPVEAAGRVLGAVTGTPPYMAPEQAEGQPLDSRADIHALGVTLHRMLTGELPAPGEPLAPAPGLDADLLALLRSMTARRPEERPSTYAQILFEIERRLRAASGPPPASSRPRTSAFALGLGFGLAALVLLPTPPGPRETAASVTPPAASERREAIAEPAVLRLPDRPETDASPSFRI